MANIIGIDQSYSSCGWCVIDDGMNIIAHGIIKSDKSINIFDRALLIATEIYRIFAIYDPTIVKLEGLAFGMTGNVTRDLAGLLFTIVSVLKSHTPGVNIALIPPTSVKKFATGSGKAKKPEMILALPEHVRQLFEQSYKKTTGLTDLADAYWIACIPTP